MFLFRSLFQQIIAVRPPDQSRTWVAINYNDKKIKKKKKKKENDYDNKLLRDIETNELVMWDLNIEADVTERVIVTEATISSKDAAFFPVAADKQKRSTASNGRNGDEAAS